MSLILGSNTSAIEGDEDIVIDSGGRQINHLNNWVESNHGYNKGVGGGNSAAGNNNNNTSTHHLYDNQNQSTIRIQEGIRNKNRVPGGAHQLHRDQRANSTYFQSPNSANLLAGGQAAGVVGSAKYPAPPTSLGQSGTMHLNHHHHGGKSPLNATSPNSTLGLLLGANSG